MTNHYRVRTITFPLRRVCAGLALGALMALPPLTAHTAPTQDVEAVAVSNDSTAVVVPDVALTSLAQGRSWADLLAGGAPTAPGTPDATKVQSAPEAPTPTVADGLLSEPTPTVLDSSGIPIRALNGYRRGAMLVNIADPGCHIDWALLAGIGRVESNHARFGGSQLDSSSVARPAIIGIPLDGSRGTARITDSDGGVLDGDKVYDRAVGPMQFIPGTWRVAGADANGDGVKNPQDMADAATAAAIYLCSGSGSLNRPLDLRSAIMRYNASDSYVRLVTAIADGYRRGGFSALPGSDLLPVISAPSNAGAAKPVTTAPLARPPASPGLRPGIPASGPAAPVRAERAPALPVPGQPSPKSLAPATPKPPVPPAPVPLATAPLATAPQTPAPTAPALVTCLPNTAPSTALPTTLPTAVPTIFPTAVPTAVPTPCLTLPAPSPTLAPTPTITPTT